ncbi:anaerobic dimethyl sulfoxide reductase subunit B [Salmonella enterica subsp. enterica]|uniref:Anaerobic dimethyl sulfoxide reductase subunit B n=1 Tax=Salmonella enterica I TaxID=59201 RepID=A0A379VRV2_SALET|nr:anaerobic dimethyl sulfoxide reductase subunit B [Salmonella enterica subsp. enterica]
MTGWRKARNQFAWNPARCGRWISAPIDELRKKHGELAAVAPLPRAHFTKPNIVIKPNANSRPTGDTTGYLANPKEV